MLKNIVIDGADLLARIFKAVSQHALSCSVWWSDYAESVETDETISSIRKGRGTGNDRRI